MIKKYLTMRKVSISYSLILLSLILLSTECIAQEKKLKVGLIAGPMVSNIDFQLLIKDKLKSVLKVGYAVGAIAELALYKKIIIQPKLLYSLKGGTRILGLDPIEKKYDWIISNGAKLGYLEAPVNILYNIKNRVKLGGGAYIGYLIHGKIQNRFDLSYDDLKIGGNYNFKRYDKGLNLQVELNIIKDFGIMYNYSQSFKDTFTPQLRVSALNIVKYF